MHAVIQSEEPTDWLQQQQRAGAGFFHSPAALATALPDGDPLYVTIRSGDDIVGLAQAVERGCRLGTRTRHVSLAAPLALHDGVDVEHAHQVMLAAFRERHAAEVSIGSFDAPGILPTPDPGTPTRARHEHIVSLDADPDAILGRFGSSHRRYARRGDRREWTLSALVNEEASATLYEVQARAAARAAERGQGFTPEPVDPDALSAPLSLEDPFGMGVFAALDDGDELASALVGWGAGRAFYLQGGSTPRGYDEHAAVWLHFAIARRLMEHGFTAYNLGGTPAEAEDSEHPQHGLHRFKQHFGAELRECRGGYWAMRPVHLGLHRALEGLRRWVSPSTDA